MARTTKSLANNKKGISPRHRDHRTHKIQNLPKKKHDFQWQQKRLERMRKRERLEPVEESLQVMTLQEV